MIFSYQTYPRVVWKRLHMMVYLAYVLIIAHVFLGAFQQETSPFTIGILVIGFIIIASLHLITAFREGKIDKAENNRKRWLVKGL